MQPCADALLGLEVEHDPVQPVLGQRPEQVAAERATAASPSRRRARSARTTTRKHDHRAEQDRRHRRVHARELVEQVGVEHARRGAQHVAAAQALELVGLGSAIDGKDSRRRRRGSAGRNRARRSRALASAGIASTIWRIETARRRWRFAPSDEPSSGSISHVGQRRGTCARRRSGSRSGGCDSRRAATAAIPVIR